MKIAKVKYKKVTSFGTLIFPISDGEISYELLSPEPLKHQDSWMDDNMYMFYVAAVWGRAQHIVTTCRWIMDFASAGKVFEIIDTSSIDKTENM